jgi:hypothetical protein
MVARLSCSKDIKPHGILDTENASAKLKPSSMGFMVPYNGQASWEIGVAWCNVVRVPDRPTKPRNQGDLSTLTPRRLGYIDWLGSKGLWNAWPIVRHEARRI